MRKAIYLPIGAVSLAAMVSATAFAFDFEGEKLLQKPTAPAIVKVEAPTGPIAPAPVLVAPSPATRAPDSPAPVVVAAPPVRSDTEVVGAVRRVPAPPPRPAAQSRRAGPKPALAARQQVRVVAVVSPPASQPVAPRPVKQSTSKLFWMTVGTGF